MKKALKSEMMMLSGNLNQPCVVYSHLIKLLSLSDTQISSLYNENNIYGRVNGEEWEAYLLHKLIMRIKWEHMYNEQIIVLLSFEVLTWEG